MRKSIRRNVFETNSSSTHSMCITKNNILDQKQNELSFRIGEFGWETDMLISPEEKAAYLYTALIIRNKLDLLQKVKEYLIMNSIQFDMQPPQYDDDYDESSDYRFLKYGYIDHSDELDDFIEGACEDENKLMRFLFSSESFIKTGNDNSSDCNTEIDVDYDHEEYYKGN
jgi:hypothetical protein